MHNICVYLKGLQCFEHGCTETCLLVAYEWKRREEKARLLFEPSVALSIPFIRDREGVAGAWGGSSVTGKSQGPSFCLMASFFFLKITGLFFFHWGLLPVIPIYYFSHWRKNSETWNVCASASLECLHMCVHKGATLSWRLQISLAHSLTERGWERQRLRDNGNGGWTKANTVFNEFLWLSLPVSGSGSPGWGCGWTDGYRAEKERKIYPGLLK